MSTGKNVDEHGERATDTQKDNLGERQPWTRRAREPMLWFSRFDRFCKDGPKRSLTGLYNFYRNSPKKTDSAPAPWKEAAKRWEWRERAEKWDEYQIEKNNREFEAERQAEHKHRIVTLQGWRGKLLDAMQKLNTDDATFGDVTNGLRMITQELRAEYDDLPTVKNELAGAVKHVFVVKYDDDIGGDIPDDASATDSAHDPSTVSTSSSE